ncbi:hypothetical protein, partial [Escherichia coli]|jgi:hypothetical protein|uniref:hypothetical protein n=1 Tax=Escherichia coli TaxID=562 RepID=UPI003B9A88FF
MIAISVDRVEQLFFRSSEIIAHFGKNPVRGGSPPSDRRMMDAMVRIMGVLFHASESVLIVVAEFVMSVMNIGTVSRM